MRIAFIPARTELEKRKGKANATYDMGTFSATKTAPSFIQGEKFRKPPFLRGRMLDYEILEEHHFVQMLRLERKRTERSGRPFMLMLLEGSELFHSKTAVTLLKRIVSAVAGSSRETDLIGWYEQDSILGTIFTEIGTADTSGASKVAEKVTIALEHAIGIEELKQFHIVFRVFPENSSEHLRHGPDFTLYPDFSGRHEDRTGARFFKRIMDVLGSLTAILLLAPAFAAIALLIKLTSAGPVLFRQKRVGQYGTTFTFLKFRSMSVDNDPKIHQEFVSRLIAGNGDLKQHDGTEAGAYKLTNDPRITPLGKLLRKSSLDELPQFFNVLLGEMSLVGPRPPVPYEFERYRVWHKRRVIEVKPGITGLWQVRGRSKTSFDDMVRLDLRYAREWSLWLDLKILLQTPAAVLSGDGAY